RDSVEGPHGRRPRRAKYADVLTSLKGVERVRGQASFTSSHEVKANGERYSGDKFVIATGSSPAVPQIPGIRDVSYLTNVAALSPRQRGTRTMITARIEDRRRTFRADALLLATGRTPNTDTLNLAAAGVAVKDDKGVKVDVEMRSTAPHVFAAGDVVGKPMLETTAAKEGYIAAENAIANRGLKMDYRAVPHAVFTNPAVASVGLTDAQANAATGVRCSCNTVLLEQVPKPVIVDDTRGLVKIVAEAESHRIIGVHVLASLAPDMVHEG